MKYKFIAGSHKCFLLLQIGSMLFVGCSLSSTKRIDTLKSGNDTLHRKPPGSFYDTVTIDFPAAVFYNPDSLQLEKIKAVTDTMIFESTIHDCFYQQRYSRNVLQKNWRKIKIVEISKVRYILFKSGNTILECMDLNTQNDPCGVFIFDGRKKAQLADMTNIDSQLARYFAD